MLIRARTDDIHFGKTYEYRKLTAEEKKKKNTRNNSTRQKEFNTVTTKYGALVLEPDSRINIFFIDAYFNRWAIAVIPRNITFAESDHDKGIMELTIAGVMGEDLVVNDHPMGWADDGMGLMIPLCKHAMVTLDIDDEIIVTRALDSYTNFRG